MRVSPFPSPLKMMQPLQVCYWENCRRCLEDLRTTTAILLLDAGVDICKARDILGHRHVTTLQIYYKRRRSTKEGISEP